MNLTLRIPPVLSILALAALLAAPSPCMSEERNRTTGQLRLIPAPEEHAEGAGLQYPIWWGTSPELEAGVPCNDPGKCVSCHESTATMDASHAIACVRCHLGDSSVTGKDEAHTGLISDPGDLRFVHDTCGKCHPEEVTRVKRSPMALAPRMINHTRFALGGQKTADSVHATVNAEELKQIPRFQESGNLGDDLLRRSCLRCHLYTKGSARWGELRGQGCSACHVAFPNSADGRPRTHVLVRNAGLNDCLKCHNANHVGNDFVGLFEKDFQRGFVSPFQHGRQPARIYGSEQHRLLPDVHFQAGMICADCHTVEEIHGTGTVSRSPESGVRISCEGCHVRGDHPAILKSDDGKMTLLRGNGRLVPSWNAQSVPHRVERHREKVRCSACHASWSFQDYGLHLMLEERADYWKWSTTAGQNDPQVQELLMKNVGTFADVVPPAAGSVPPIPEDQWELPVTRDWLTGEERPGAWFRGLTLRRWSKPPLGLDSRGKVSVMRPMYQYVISHVDAADNLLLDRHIPETGGGFPALIFNPYAPHTIAKVGRACHECHGDPKAVGMGEAMPGIEKPGIYPIWASEDQIPGHNFRWDALVDPNGNALQYSTHPGAGPLDAETVKRLLKPSDRHRAMWYEFLKENQAPHP